MPKSTKHEKFLSFLDQIQGIIHKVSHTYCRDPMDREDLVQEIILQLYKAFPRYKPKFKASTWTYRIALNVAISYKRKKEAIKRQRPAHIREEQAVIGEQETANKEKLDFLYQCIDQLNDLDKALMVLYLEDKSHQEMADILGISKSNVGTRLSRTKASIKKKMNLLEKDQYGIE